MLKKKISTVERRYRELKGDISLSPNISKTNTSMPATYFPSKVGVKDVLKEVPGATKKVFGAIGGAAAATGLVRKLKKSKFSPQKFEATRKNVFGITKKSF